MCDSPTCLACRTQDQADILAGPIIEKLSAIIGKDALSAAGIPDEIGPIVQMRVLVTTLAAFCAAAPDDMRMVITARVFHDLGDLYNRAVPAEHSVNISQAVPFEVNPDDTINTIH